MTGETKMIFTKEITTKEQFEEAVEEQYLDLFVGQNGVEERYFNICPFKTTEEEAELCFYVDSVFMKAEARDLEISEKKWRKDHVSIWHTAIFTTPFGRIWRMSYIDKGKRKIVSTMWEDLIMDCLYPKEQKELKAKLGY